MPETTWVTPVEAGRLVASYLGADSVTSGRTQIEILVWVLSGKVAAMALEVTKCEDEPESSSSAPILQAPSPSVLSADDGLPVAYRVNGAYRPARPAEGRLVELHSSDYMITVQDWHNALDAGTLFERFWSSSEVSHALAGQRHPQAHVAYAGIRLSKEDVKRRIQVAGWDLRSAKGEAATSAAESNTPATQWSVAEMDQAITDCGYSNRDKAWREHFKSRRAEHGWNVEAFRNRWAKARGTEGFQGRPSKSA